MSKRTPQHVMDDLAARVSRNPERARKIGGVYEFVLDGEEGGTWHLDMNEPAVRSGPSEKMNVRIRMKAEDFVAVADGKLNPMLAFTTGRLKVEGNLALAIKLQQVLSPQGW